MYILQTFVKNHLLHKIIQILKRDFPELFKLNHQGRPRKYCLCKVWELFIHQAHIYNLSLKKS